MLETALQYARMGFFILPVRNKRPLVAWQDHQTTAPTPDQIARWWKTWPDAGVAAITGRGMVVVDVDQPFESEKAAREAMGLAPTALVARTPRGGFHFYYRHAGRVSNSVNTTKKLDIRGDGGIVVMPPTPGYIWLSKGKMGTYVPPEPVLATPAASDKTKHWISDLLAGVGQGGRNDAAARLSGYFLGKGLGKDIVYQLLAGWNAKNTPPLPEHELRRTIESVSARGSSSADFNLTGFGDYLRKWAHLVLDWTIDDWLPDSTILMVVALPGSYKTWLTVDLAVSVASGSDFLGMFHVKKPGPVLFVQQEDSHPGVASRLARVSFSKIPAPVWSMTEGEEWEVPQPPDMPIHVHEERSLRFEDKAVMERFEHAIATHRPRLVILDPLYSFLSTDDYMAKIGDHMLELKMLRDKYACSFVLVHHARKSADGAGNRTDSWGSVFVDASREGGWSLAKTAGDAIDVVRHFKDGGEFPPLPLQFHISDDGSYRVEMVAGDADENAIVSALAKPGKVEDIATRSGLTVARVRSLLQRMINEGLVDKLPGGRYGLNESSIESDL